MQGRIFSGAGLGAVKKARKKNLLSLTNELSGGTINLGVRVGSDTIAQPDLGIFQAAFTLLSLRISAALDFIFGE